MCRRVSKLRSRGICVPQTLVLHMPLPPPMTMHLPPHLRLLEPMPLFLPPAPCPLPQLGLSGQTLATEGTQEMYMMLQK